MKLTGFVLPRATVDAIFAQIEAIAPVAVPARFPVDADNDIIVADEALFATRLAEGTYGDHPLAQQLLKQLGGWVATKTVEVTIPAPVLPVTPASPAVAWSVVDGTGKVVASGKHSNPRFVF